MEFFEDSKGNKRSLSLTIGRARRVAKSLGIDFIDGDATKIANDLLIKPTLQLDLIWALLEDKAETNPDGELTAQEAFEETFLDSGAFENARVALIAEIGNFIQSLRPEFAGVFQNATQLIQSQITQSANRAASLLQSKEVTEGFLQASADAERQAKKEISKQFSKLQADLE